MTRRSNNEKWQQSGNEGSWVTKYTLRTHLWSS